MATLEPPSALGKAKTDFIRHFYEISDREDVLDGYVDAFAPDADLLMGLAVCKGQDAIRKFRPGMWTAISKRAHKPKKVYLGEADNEVMLYGTVDYVLRKTGTAVDGVQWAGRMVFDQSAPADQPRLAFYQVWMDSTTMKEALAKEQ